MESELDREKGVWRAIRANKRCQPVPQLTTFLVSSSLPHLSLFLLSPLCLFSPFFFTAQCITSWHREKGYNSSLQLPDATLNFAKKHPLMEEKAQARPLLLTKGINFTRLAVDRVSALDTRAYNMLFLGTGSY